MRLKNVSVSLQASPDGSHVLITADLGERVTLPDLPAAHCEAALKKREAARRAVEKAIEDALRGAAFGI